MQKKCTRCHEEKLYSQFQIRAASKDGLTASCKQCLSKYDKKRANLPHRVEARKQYAQTEEGIAAGNRAKKKWEDSNPIKRAVHIMVGNYVRDGKLVKQNECSACGAQGQIEGHHDDYALPLEVTWLCSDCHRKWHAENGEAKNA